MPLTLSLHPKADFFVDNIRVRVIEVEDPFHFKLKVFNRGVSSVFNITYDAGAEILPSVCVQAGFMNPRCTGSVKVVIQAPRNMKILRGKLYRESHPEWQPNPIR
jgi:hypothetical protein